MVREVSFGVSVLNLIVVVADVPMTAALPSRTSAVMVLSPAMRSVRVAENLPSLSV